MTASVLDFSAVPPPPESRHRRAWLDMVDPRLARSRCGISQATVARALGVTKAAVNHWESGHRKTPSGKAGEAYCRVIAGLARHLEIPEGDG
jgi:DNA-binding transcriptional regulator YiaG